MIFGTGTSEGVAASELPLQGLLVVACEQAVAAPLATRHLGDLGATVVKVERPGAGDFARGYDTTVKGMSSHFVWLNRGKLSLTLDLKLPQANEVMVRLLQGADVFVQNLGPGAADRLRLGGADLLSRYPRLVACEISGYGRSGPWSNRKAYDLLVQAEAGLVGVTGSPGEPAKAGIAAADIAAGMYAFSGILAALLDREKTGKGRLVEISLLDSLAEWMGYPFYYAHYGGSPPPRAGANHATIAPYGPVNTEDGAQVLLAVQNDAEWRSLCHSVLERPELVEDPRFASNSSRVANRSELDSELAPVFARFSVTALVERLERARIAYGRVNEVGELDRHPQLAGRQRWHSVGTPVGPVLALAPPIDLGGSPAMGPVPGIGEHVEAVLASLGYSTEEISAMRAEGVV